MNERMYIKVEQEIELDIERIADNISDYIIDLVADELPGTTYFDDLDEKTQKDIFREVIQCLIKRTEEEE